MGRRLGLLFDIVLLWVGCLDCTVLTGVVHRAVSQLLQSVL